MWNEIKNEIDIENLMKKYSGFHDSCIVSINYHSGAFVDDNGGMANGELLDHSIEMILHSQWNKPIELRFTGVRKCNIVGWQDNYFCDILGVYMSFHTDLLGKTCDDKLIVWADWDCFNPITYTEEKLISPNGKNCTYVIAEKAVLENNDGELIRRDKIQSCGEIESNRRLEFAGGVRMKCPVCGNEFKKGVIEAKDAGSLTQSLTMLTWYPEEYKGKLVKKNTINLRLKTDGYYCDECMMVYAAFEEK